MKRELESKGRRSVRGLGMLLLAQVACSSEATSPSGGAAVGKVVPKVAHMLVPDVWCPADRTRDDTLRVSHPPACDTTSAAWDSAGRGRKLDTTRSGP